MRNFLIFCIVLIIGLSLIALDRPFREEDMLIANMEEPISDVQPNWATDSLNVKGVGRIPNFGDAHDVFIIDSFAYAGLGQYFGIFNIKDISNPLLIGSILLPDYAWGVNVVGNYAYVADWNSGLRIIDISDPSKPFEVSNINTTGTAIDIFVLGNYAYVGADIAGIRIIDISIPTVPVEVGHYETDRVRGIFVVGNYAYVANDYDGLQVFDVSTPSNPTSVDIYDTPGRAQDVYVSGNYAYVADYDYGLRVIDVSTPSNISEIGYYNTAGNSFAVSVSGDYAYIADYSSGLRVINISNPVSPTLVSTSATSGYAYGLCFSDGYACMAVQEKGLEFIDVSDPAVPFLISSFDTPENTYSVFVLDSFAYVAEDVNGISIFNISSNAIPDEIGSFNTSGNAYDVDVSENYAYVADGSSGMRILNISDPANPYEVGSYNTPGIARDIFISGDYAYVADLASGLRILRISNPSTPFSAGIYDTPGNAYSVYVVGGYAYVADGVSGLIILDMSNPSSPSYVGSYNTSGTAVDIFVSGNHAYVADSLDGIQIIDVSNPASPNRIGYYNTSGISMGVYTSGNYAYLADGSYGLKVFDVSTPSSPTLQGYYNTSSNSKRICLSGIYIYLADDNGGFYILQDYFTHDSISPEAFDLVSPNGDITDNQPEFIWNTSNDIHFKQYEIFVNGISKAITLDTAYSFISSLADGEYNWYVVASDSSGNIKRSTQIDTFRVDATKPSTPVLLYPANDGYTNNGEFTWHKSTDAFSGVKNYELWYDDDSMFGSPSTETMTDTNYSVVLAEQKYYWKVRATDNFDNIGDWAVIWSFEFDSNAPIAPSLQYPISGLELEDSNIVFNWNAVSKNIAEIKEKNKKDINSAPMNYIIEIDTSITFTSLVILDTNSTNTDTLKILKDDKYFWRVRAYDEAGNQGIWSEADSFLLDIKIPHLVLNAQTYNFGEVDIDEAVNWGGLYLKNSGDAQLAIDSVGFTSGELSSDTTYTFPIQINPLDSLNFELRMLASDTGMISCRFKVFHNIYSVQYDSLDINAYCGIPTVIDSAKAFDGVNAVSGIDDDDYVLLYFNQSTNGAILDAVNISSVLDLSNGHTWLDGFGVLGTTSWNPSNNVLLVNMTTSLSNPTVSIGDTIYPDSLTIIGTLNGFKCHNPVVLTGDFSPSGISEKLKEDEKKGTLSMELKISRNEIRYTTINNDNSFTVYDIAGKVIFEQKNIRAGIHAYSKGNLTSGIYFIKLKDGDNEINKKTVIIK